LTDKKGEADQALASRFSRANREFAPAEPGIKIAEPGIKSAEPGINREECPSRHRRPARPATTENPKETHLAAPSTCAGT
jgi:hypothetical protein